MVNRMGWCAISFCDDIWNMFKEFIPEEKRKEMALKLIGRFEDEDMDDMCCDSSVEKAAGIKYEE